MGNQSISASVGLQKKKNKDLLVVSTSELEIESKEDSMAVNCNQDMSIVENKMNATHKSNISSSTAKSWRYQRLEFSDIISTHNNHE